MNAITGWLHYDVHGVEFSIRSNHPAIAQSLGAWLEPFAVAQPRRTRALAEFSCVPDAAAHRVAAPAGRARPVYDSPLGGVFYDGRADQLYLQYDDLVRLRCDWCGGRISVSIARAALGKLDYIARPLFLIPLIELLKRHGRYSVHAAGFCVEGQGLLLAGTSGAGKSTLAIALARAGFQFLGDDMLFLERGETGVRLLAFPEDLRVTEATLALLPGLRHVARASGIPESPKYRLHPADLGEIARCWSCRPVALLFPRVGRGATSAIAGIGRDTALLDLAPNVLLTEPRSSQAHLDALADLVRQTRCYRIETGIDFDRLAAALRELVVCAGARSVLESAGG